MRELAEAVASTLGEHAVVLDGRILQTRNRGSASCCARRSRPQRSSVPVIFDGFSELSAAQGAALMALLAMMSRSC